MRQKFSNSSSLLSNAITWVKDNHVLLLILLTLILFTSKSLYNVPVAIMAIMGLWKAVCSRGHIFSDPVVRGYSLMFLALWLPLLFSLTDAANIGHSLKTTLPYLRFLFMGIYILHEKNRLLDLDRLKLLIFCVAAFWGIDGSIQYLAGHNLAGYPYEAGHITGMFYPRNTIAHMLAALSPIYFESIRQYSARFKWTWLLVLPVIAVILLSGRRAAWIMLFLSLVGYIYYLFRFELIGKNARKNLLLVLLTGLLTMLLIILGNKPLQERLMITAGVFSLDYETTDLATARRLPIWQTSLTVFRDNWINGVGPRGFRHVYQQYSSEDNFWYTSPPTHPHQLILEIIVETGMIGLFGLLVFIWLSFRIFITYAQLNITYPWVLSLIIIMFPFNTNLAFYSSYWSSVIWWFIVLTFVVVKASRTNVLESKRST